MPTQVDTPISTLSDQEIAAYLGSKGSPLPQEIIDDPDLLEFFMKPIRSDYACLESYTDEPNADSVSSSVVVLGGELDTGIPVDKLETWTHRFKERDSSIRVFTAAGHFFLNDRAHSASTIAIVADKLGAFSDQSLQGVQLFEVEPATNKETAYGKNRGQVVAELIQLYADVLGEPAADITADSDFFNIGGDSLMTVEVLAGINTRLGEPPPPPPTHSFNVSLGLPWSPCSSSAPTSRMHRPRHLLAVAVIS